MPSSKVSSKQSQTAQSKVIPRTKAKGKNSVVSSIAIAVIAIVAFWLYNNYYYNNNYTVTYSDILEAEQNAINSNLQHQEIRENNSTVLGYITPWNRDGYTQSLKYSHKLSHVSPVWFRLKPTLTETYVIEGKGDVNEEWLTAIRSTNTLVFPRVQMGEGWTEQDYMGLINQQPLQIKAINLITELCKQYDGIVLETGVPVQYLYQFIQRLGKALHKLHLKLILVLPPSTPRYDSHPELIVDGNQLWRGVSDAVDLYSLMTYDYNTDGKGGPNAPVEWIEQEVGRLCVNTDICKRLLVGLNYYGYSYDRRTRNTKAIIGKEYLRLLETARPSTIKWDSKAKEHLFEHESRVVYYPTVQSIRERKMLIKRLKVKGKAIWELGQGLEQFYSLL